MYDALAVFDQLVRAVAVAGDAAAQHLLVDTFVARYPVSPLVGGDQAVIWCCGEGQMVILRGDMLQERSERFDVFGRDQRLSSTARPEPLALIFVQNGA